MPVSSHADVGHNNMKVNMATRNHTGIWAVSRLHNMVKQAAQRQSKLRAYLGLEEGQLAKGF